MPIDDLAVTDSCISALRLDFNAAHGKIIHCVDQLDDEQFNWRPFEQQNSIANVILHLCGNVRQWIIAGVEEKPDTRRRAVEFSDRGRYARADLLQRLSDVVREADQTLARITPATITQKRHIQARDVTVMDAVVHCVTHFVGHSHEVIYITRLQIGDKYKFKFVPTREQGGA
jgi:uncharacterized damage-inducible protein DinB